MIKLHPISLASCLTLALMAMPTLAVDEPPRPPMTALGKIRDLAATVKARRMIEEDPTLAALNLGVDIENGLARIWGPIPSEKVGEKAVLKLKMIPDISEVRPTFYLEDPTKNPITIANNQEELKRVAVAKPEIETGQIPNNNINPTPIPEGQPSKSPEVAPRLFAPRVSSKVRTNAETLVRNSAEATESLSDQIRGIQKSDSRFSSIQVENQGGNLMVRRNDVNGRTVMELVSKLRQLPGVRNVMIASD
ncbi:MAG: hypothetical protein ACKO23_18245 [Gemmataceae bacterium]